MFRFRLGYVASCLAVLGVGGMLHSATLTLNPSVKYQTIDGFGGFGPMEVWWSGGPFFNDAYLATLIDNLGFTVIRNEYYSEESGQDANWAKQLPWVTAVTNYARTKNEPLKWILTAWTPPSSMKDNNSLKNGGTLRSTSYNAYGDWWASGVNKYKTAGADVLGVSMQNEPRFVEPYNSCVMLPAQYHDVLKIVQPKIKAVSPTTIMFGPEDMLATSPNFQEYTDAIKNDTATRGMLGAAAVHGYTESGTSPGSIGTGSIIRLNYLWSLAKTYGYRTWQTETSGYSADWAGSMSIAASIQYFLRYGKMSMWTYWYTSGDLMSGTSVTQKGAIHKHFSRYIRPGAVMIDAKMSAADSTNLRPCAFYDATRSTLTITLLNAGTAAVTADIQGPGIPATFKKYQTTSSENCADKGNVSSGSVSIPASSLVTLVATYTVGVSPQAAAVRQRRTAALQDSRVFSVDGRQLTSAAKTARNSAGVSPGVHLRSDGSRMVNKAR